MVQYGYWITLFGMAFVVMLLMAGILLADYLYHRKHPKPSRH